MPLVEEEGKQNPSLGLEDVSYGEGVIRFDHRRGILHMLKRVSEQTVASFCFEIFKLVKGEWIPKRATTPDPEL